MTYTVEKGLVRSKKGIPAGERWFADNRLAIAFDETGINRVEYKNPRQTAGNSIVFYKPGFDGIRYFLEYKGVTLPTEFHNTLLWPFGLEAEQEFMGEVLKHSIYTVKDSIVIKLITPAGVPEGLRFKLEFYENSALIPADQGNPVTGTCGAKRTWDKWTFLEEENALSGRYEETTEAWQKEETDIRSSYVEYGETTDRAALNIFLGGDFPLRHSKRSLKHILCSPELEPNKEYCFVISFLSDDKAPLAEYKKELEAIRENLEKLFVRYRKVMERSPVLVSPYEELNRFVSLAPLYHEAMKIEACPGAIRAKTSNYWVWGWDGMTSNNATLYWGDREFIRDMLEFYEKTAHPERGIAHAYRNDMSVSSISDLPAQGMYITLLQHYYNATKDMETVKLRYSFAKKVYLSIAAAEVQGTGYCKGTSLFPDFPVFMKETGQDISAFNNTVFYCASRSMEYLAALLGDAKMSGKCEEIFKKMENNFRKLFFDEEKGFPVNSVDAVTLAKRDCYSSNAVKWENEYCQELLGNISVQSLRFFEENFVCRAGIRPMPVWDSAFDGDANQLHSWWPVMGEYYMKLINENNRTDLIRQWIGWVSYWTAGLTIPEGIPCYIDTTEPEYGFWDTLRGTWQTYSIRGWYQALLHGVVGVEIDGGGMTLYPYEGEEMKLLGLHYLDKTVDIEMLGSGCYLERVEVNGSIIEGTNKLPSEVFDRESVNIRAYRVKEKPYVVYLKEAVGTELESYSFDSHRMSAVLRGAGTSRIKLGADKDCKVRLDGKEILPVFDSEAKTAVIELKLKAGEARNFEAVF